MGSCQLSGIDCGAFHAGMVNSSQVSHSHLQLPPELHLQGMSAAEKYIKSWDLSCSHLAWAYSRWSLCCIWLTAAAAPAASMSLSSAAAEHQSRSQGACAHLQRTTDSGKFHLVYALLGTTGSSLLRNASAVGNNSSIAATSLQCSSELQSETAAESSVTFAH